MPSKMKIGTGGRQEKTLDKLHTDTVLARDLTREQPSDGVEVHTTLVKIAGSAWTDFC